MSADTVHELKRRLSLASRALTWFYDDHVEQGDPPCPCEGCVKARAAFAANLAPLPAAVPPETTT